MSDSTHANPVQKAAHPQMESGFDGGGEHSYAPPSIQLRSSGPIQRQEIYGGSSGDPTQSDPRAEIPIRDFITYVEAAEAGYSNASNQEIITRIRQEYYSGIAFDQLIPGAPTHTLHTYYSPYGGGATAVRNTLNRNRMDDTAYDHLTAHADENSVQDNPSPYIVLDNGEKLDVGHMMLELDALIHPGAGAPYTTYGVPNIDPSSWVADLGIAAVWMQHHEDEGEQHGDAPRNIANPDMDEYYDMSAPIEDIIGDVDSFGVYGEYQADPNAPLSTILRRYYLGENGQAGSINRRWQTFCQMNGLHYTNNGGTITWSQASINTYIERINRFNTMYAAGMFGSGWETATFWSDPDITEFRHTETVLQRFLDYLKPKVEAELR